MNGPLAVLCVAVTFLWVGTVTVTAFYPLRESCCMPDQWEGTEKVAAIPYSVSAFDAPSVTFITSNTSYDATMEMETNDLRILHSSGALTFLKIISDYRSNVRYYVYKDSGLCETEELNTPFPKRCIPEPAYMVDKYVTYGSGDHTLDVSRIEFRTETEKATKNFELISTNDCMPVLELCFTARQNTFITTIEQFQDIHVGISSDHVFDVPLECEDAQARNVDSDPLAELWKELKSR